MDINEIVVKSEAGEEILLFYVDENGVEQSIVTSVDNVVTQPQIVEEIVNGEVVQTIESTEILENNSANEEVLYENQNKTKDRWTEDETKQLLIFYIDNKLTFTRGLTRKKHLWSVACENMLPGKNATSCEMKLHNIKKKYAQMRMDENRRNWPFFDLCHQAFHDDPSLNSTVFNANKSLHNNVNIQKTNTVNENGIVIIKKADNRTVLDDKVVAMLQLYIKHKKQIKNVSKEFWQKGIWSTIALEMGDIDPEYWRKKFLNFKQNYIRLLDKKQETGNANITWPYLQYFDEIFKDDEEFKRKYVANAKANNADVSIKMEEPNWDTTEMTVLAKYYFDCFNEFMDPTIPNKFLWKEVGRLLDRPPELCEIKFKNMKKSHMESMTDNKYDVNARVPLAIIIDNIISKEVAMDLEKSEEGGIEIWETEETDELVKFLYENVDMLKDPICYNVCWAYAAKKFNRTVVSCKRQWDSLVSLYDSILKDKKENPDMEIDWRYIDLFDRIFDYGMNQELFKGYNTQNTTMSPEKTVNVGRNSKYNTRSKYNNDEDEEFSEDDGNLLTARRQEGEAKAFRILEFYLKHKDTFNSSNRLKSAIWEQVAKEVKMTPAQCAHRFRNLKQVYMSYLTRECKRPDKPIVWPYYALCKKVFGYRALKSKILKKTDSDFNIKEWTTKDIKMLIEYFAQNFAKVNSEFSNLECWSELAQKIGKDEEVCKDKFLELRKSYRKLKTMLTRNPNTNISWKYFPYFEQIYENRADATDLSYIDGNYEVMDIDDEIKKEIQDDEDIQCIIVVPEGQDIEDMLMNNKFENVKSEEISSDTVPKEHKTPLKKWTKKTKKQLLLHYLNYLRAHKGMEIDSVAMWKEIASKLPNKTPLSCRKIFAKLKRNRLNVDNVEEIKKQTPYYTLIEKILALKPKFIKKNINPDGSLKKTTRTNDVPMPKEIVKFILEYYLEHLEEFLSPRYDKKTVWTELANKVGESMIKVHNKVMFLKNVYSKKDDNVHEEIPFEDILEKIFEEQKVLKEKIAIEKQEYLTEQTDFSENDSIWNDNEIEQLLIWYLLNLDKFKNPKYLRSYLWRQASLILSKSPVACSKKMAEMRTEYRTKVRETPEQLGDWRFFDLCQKIYGTGKKINYINVENTSTDMPML